MDELKAEREKKNQLLEAIGKLRDMRRGSVVEQYYEAKRRDGAIVRQGPYFLYSYKEAGQTVSRRLSGPGEAERYREEIAEFRRFEELSGRLIETSHRLCDLKSQAAAAAGEDAPEKKLRRRSGRKSGRKSAG